MVNASGKNFFQKKNIYLSNHFVNLNMIYKKSFKISVLIPLINNDLHKLLCL